MQLISECLARIVLLHGQYALECLLLAAEDLHLFLVCVEVLLKPAYRIVQIIQLSLQVRCVVRSLTLVTRRHVH